MLPFIYVLNSRISTFNLLIAIGVIVGILVFYNRANNVIKKSSADDLVMIVVISGACGFVCGMLFDKIAHFNNFIDFKENLFRYTGITFLGGLIGGLSVFVVIYKIIFKDYKDLSKHLDIIVPCFVIAQGFGRIGCFLGGCCFGKPCSWGVYYPDFSMAYRLYGHTRVLPMPLIESCFLFVLLGIMIKFVKKELALFYFAMYGVFRFVAEFWRGDNRGEFLMGISPSQCLCVVLILIVFIFKKNLLKG